MNDRVSEELLAAAADQGAAEVIERVQVQALNFLDFINAEEGELTTLSTMVSIIFRKPHNDLLKAIRALQAILPSDRQGYFSQTVCARENPSGGADIESPAYIISRDGFVLLAMGFTGKRALACKLAYMDAFNAMHAYIKNQREGLQYRFLETELKFNNEKQKVSCSASNMRKWQKTKPALQTEMDKLQEQLQPKLV